MPKNDEIIVRIRIVRNLESTEIIIMQGLMLLTWFSLLS